MIVFSYFVKFFYWFLFFDFTLLISNWTSTANKVQSFI